MEPSTVSIIIPALDEEATIDELLAALSAQTYPLDLIDVAIADGMSRDATRERIAAYAAAHPDLVIRVIDNPGAVIPVGLNRAIAAATGDLVLRLDAHCTPQPTYVERTVAALVAGKGDVVGGRWEVRTHAQTPIARSIVQAVTHPLGIGGARYRFSEREGEVETVPFGAWRRSLLIEVGGFDEALEANQDFELNHRIRLRGGRVWFDPTIRSTYYCRETLRRLGRQYRRYGVWKVRMLRRDRANLKSLRPRQVAPTILLASLVLLAIGAPFATPIALLLTLETGLYGGLLLAVGVRLALRNRDPVLVLGVPAAIATLHLTWAFGFWSELVRARSARR